MNIKDWIRTNLLKSLALLIAIAIIPQFIFLYIGQTRELANQENAINRYKNVITLGIQQSNRPLIESTLFIASHELKTQGLAICEKNVPMISLTEVGFKPCDYLAPTPWLKRRVVSNIEGYPDITFHVESPLITNTQTLIIVLLGVLLSLISTIIIFLRIKRAIDNEIISPIQHGLGKDKKLEIIELEKVREDIKLAQLASEEKAITAAVLRHNAQIAHDIKSPLVALDMFIKDLTGIPEERRIIIRSATSRIHDIANALLSTNKKMSIDGGGVKESVLLYPLLETILSEKRIQNRARSTITLDGVYDKSSYDAVALLDESKFKRVISNLLNNAVEAIKSEGRVALTLKRVADKITLTITDNGSGIPKDMLDKIGRYGQTFGKDGGSGLGLAHAIETVRSFDGELTILSETGRGTTINIELPAKELPAWLAPAVALKNKTKFIVVDDDVSIHQVWKGRLESIKANESDVLLLSFGTPNDFKSYFKNLSILNDHYFFIDYEFIGHDQTGLDLISELNLKTNTTLVTSRYEEKSIRERCSILGIKLIPKSMATFIPLTIEDSKIENRAIHILIDNDALVRMVWEQKAKNSGAILHVYESESSFLTSADNANIENTIYIDQDLDHGIKGEDVAKRLNQAGFKNLYLATGYEASTFKERTDLQFLKGIMSKNAPW